MRWDDAGLDRVGNEGIAEDTFSLQTYRFIHTLGLRHLQGREHHHMYEAIGLAAETSSSHRESKANKSRSKCP